MLQLQSATVIGFVSTGGRQVKRSVGAAAIGSGGAATAEASASSRLLSTTRARLITSDPSRAFRSPYAASARPGNRAAYLFITGTDVPEAGDARRDEVTARWIAGDDETRDGPGVGPRDGAVVVDPGVHGGAVQAARAGVRICLLVE